MITLRLATSRDAPAIQAIYAPIVAQTIISFEREPPSVEDMAQRISTTLQQYAWLVACDDGQVIGYAYASQHNVRWAYQWACNVSVYVDHAWRGRSVGRNLYLHLLDVCRRQGYMTACAGISLPNPASVGLHESLGFQPIGIYRQVGYKFGAWHDVGWWQCDLQNRPAQPKPPIPISMLDQ